MMGQQTATFPQTSLSFLIAALEISIILIVSINLPQMHKEFAPLLYKS
jgi:hypothetical protein